MPQRLKDLAGQRIGHLIVLRRDADVKPVRWICACDCGNVKSIEGTHLKKGQQTCGCFTGTKNKKPKTDISGKTFGCLTVLEYVGKERWRCQCSCGKVKTFYKSSIMKEQSCGHIAAENAKRRLKEDNTLGFIHGTVASKLASTVDGRTKPRNPSGITGVNKIKKKSGKIAYVAIIHHRRIRYYLGQYDTIEEAAAARHEAEAHLWTADIEEYLEMKKNFKKHK